MRASRLLAVSLAALGSTGCLASKGDIRLLQEELRAARADAARSDSLHQRQIDSLVAALSSLSAMQIKGDKALQQSLQQTDSRLTDLSNRVKTSDINTNERFKSMNDDLAQVQELVRQNMRGVTAARAAAEQAAAAPPPTPAPATATDTTVHTAPAASTAPGPATLLLTGRAAILQQSCRSARRSFEDLIKNWPNAPEAAEAQFLIGESFVSCPEGGNPASADSVYQLVTQRYPKSEFAATALWKRADSQQKLGNADAAKTLLQRIVCEYPKSLVYKLATERLGTPARCK